jgi:CxxC motif-containing protein
MAIINKHTCKLPISVGDIIISDVFGADIVATKNIE